MDWSSIIPAAIAFLTAFILPIIFAKRKKESAKKVKTYSQELLKAGVDFDKIDKDDDRIQFVKKMSWGQKAEGIFVPKNKKIDFIFLISVSSQYGVNYFLEYIVLTTFHLREGTVKNTAMKVKKDSLFGGEPQDVLWKGDPHLAQKLDMDYELKHHLLHGHLKHSKVNLKIIPEQKQGYTRIKTNFMPPSPELISFIDSVAGHIKTGF
ncbi:MAG: hypothetical protein GF421_10420 [Candidatus Aminicenantes bacterium]|nr:hypothetical protein [Candidatus Aminicenantes bacterium]